MLVPNLRYRHPGSLWASAWCNDAPRDWSGYSQCLELRANIFIEKGTGCQYSYTPQQGHSELQGIPMLWCASLCGLFIWKRPNTHPGNTTWNFYRQRLTSSFHRVLPNLVSLQVVNRTIANMAISSFSEKYISPRGFNQMKNDRVRCLTSKRSKRMIWIAQTCTIWSPRGSKIQNKRR